MQIYSPEETRALLPYSALAEAVRTILGAHAAGDVAAPPRQAVALAAQGTLLLMPASSGDLGVVKLVTVHPGNAAQGWPTIQGEVLVLDARTGERLYLLDGVTVTARRTAAVSLLAAQMLAPHPKGPLLIVGAGVQARAHLEAFVEGLGVKEVFILSRTFTSAESLAVYARDRGVNARAILDPTEVLATVTLIVTATTSRKPVISDRCRNDVFVAAVGAYRPDMVELPRDLIQRAQVYVDTVEGALHEAGDLIQAGVNWSDVTPLRAELDRSPAIRPIVFKSVGHALWDLAAAQLVYQQLRQR